MADCTDVPAGHRFLRAYSDLVAVGLLDRWWQPNARLLSVKTDLYDENWSPAVFRRLGELSGFTIGIDISPRVAVAAREHLGDGAISAADVRSLPFGDESADRILSLSTIDHFRSEGDIRASLAEFRRVLRPGGEMILTMDNPSNPVVWLRNALPFEFLHRVGLVPYFVGKTMGRRALIAELAQAGFEVRECMAAMHFPRVAVLAAHRLAASGRARRRVLGFLRKCEFFGRWPTRFLTGYFTAVHAVKAV